MKGKGIRNIAVFGLLIVAMFAMALPVQATQTLTATSYNTDVLTSYTYNFPMSYAWVQYYTTAGVYKGYLFKWTYASSFDINPNHMRPVTINSYYGSITGTNVADYNGYYYGECVSFVKSLAKSTVATSSWTRGANVVWAYPPIARGTAIAKFNADGTYDSWGGTGHVAILDRYYYENGVLKGILVWDQNYVYSSNSGYGLVGYHMIPITGSGGTSDAAAYYVVQVP